VNVANWVRREAEATIYKDATGYLTRYLRDNSEGSFPPQIDVCRDFEANPIEYHLDVQTTIKAPENRFSISSGQYERVRCLSITLSFHSKQRGADYWMQMESMALGIFQKPTKVYVLVRICDLNRWNVKMKIFVDPMRLKGSELACEADQWFITTR
jgi:hypothetical protein